MLTDRLRLVNTKNTDDSPQEEPEDYLSSSLGVIFPDDITNQHGDIDHSVVYSSPCSHVGDITLTVADCKKEDTRLFANSVWNAAVQMGVFIEGGDGQERGLGDKKSIGSNGSNGSRHDPWDVRGLRVLELGAGTGLAGIIAAKCGAAEVVISDYPTAEILENIRSNISRNIKNSKAEAIGHEWGQVGGAIADNSQPTPEETFATTHQASFDRVLVADCLWMPWTHKALMESINWFMAPTGRALVVAGFHSGRAKMAGFFDEAALWEEGLCVESIWERNAEGIEREWAADRGVEDVTGRKRWLACAVLKKI